MLIAPQLLVGASIGMLISPLFKFILASVTDDEVGSASGVPNALEQLAGAVGVAAIGRVFFTTLTLMLPRRAREPEAQTEAVDAVDHCERAYSMAQ